MARGSATIERVKFALKVAPLLGCLLLVSGANAEGTEPTARCVPPARLYVVAPDGTGSTRLTGRNFAPDRFPAWAPDGSRIAFERGGEILIVSANGGRPAKLTDTRVRERRPTWSPDGTQIAYQRGYRMHQIVVAQVDGSAARAVTIGFSDDVEPAWSPDGSRIAFASSRLGTYDLFTMSPDGSRLADLTRSSALDERSPSWSPNGSRIAYAAGGDIYVVNADGSGRARLTSNDAADSRPSWSPDGSAIAFVRSAGGSPSVLVMRADGSGPRLLAGLGDSPAWSPDGRRIAFSLDRSAPAAGAATCVVPSILGLRLSDAHQSVLRRRCVPGRTRYVPSMHPHGRVIRQYPHAGAVRAERACVYPVLSAGRV